MSSERGNVKRTRPQKYQNVRAFRNDLYDNSKKTKLLNSLEITDVCVHCKGVLEWRIKYKKYKLIKAPTKCVKCCQKTVVLSYRTICAPCAVALNVCPKCGKNENEIKSVSGSNSANISECEYISTSTNDNEDTVYITLYYN